MGLRRLEQLCWLFSDSEKHGMIHYKLSSACLSQKKNYFLSQICFLKWLQSSLVPADLSGAWLWAPGWVELLLASDLGFGGV